MRNVIGTMFLAGALLVHGEAIAAPARLDAVVNETNVMMHVVSFYFRESPHLY
jgi:hypothetical protein